MKMVSVIIVQYNNGRLTAKAVESLRDCLRLAHEVILVDNGSTEGETLRFLEKSSADIVVRNEENLGFSRGNNIGAQRARGEILAFLNNDVVVESDFLSPIVRQFEEQADLGIVGPRIENADGSLQLSCGALPWLGREVMDKVIYRLVDSNWRIFTRYVEEKYSAPQTVGWVTGAALCIPAQLFRQLGGFDENIFMFFEDKDLCLRTARLGRRILYFPSVTIRHLRGATAKSQPSALIRSAYRGSQLYYYRKHRSLLEYLFVGFYQKLMHERD